MRNFAYSLLYLALVGFVATIIVNLFHHLGLGGRIFVISLFLVLFGSILSLFLSRNGRDLNASQRKKDLLAATYTFATILAVLIILNIFFKIFYFPALSAYLSMWAMMNTIFYIASVLMARLKNK
ncbi:MAG: hypothetical protein JWQ38_574 [Flavipsychrobacter sp.]|nr:hypothetical protein [Flavipsychrobacter sp.]